MRRRANRWAIAGSGLMTVTTMAVAVIANDCALNHDTLLAWIFGVVMVGCGLLAGWFMASIY